MRSTVCARNSGERPRACVTLLEKKLELTKPAYREYVERTSAFFPWWPADRGSPPR